MRYIIIVCVLLHILLPSVYAIESIDEDTNTLLENLPTDASEMMDHVDLEEQDVMHSLTRLLKASIEKCMPAIRDGMKTAGILLTVVFLCSLCSTQSSDHRSCVIVGVLGMFAAIMGSVSTFVQLSKDTIQNLADFSAMLLPIMASAMAVSGNPVTAAGLHAWTALGAQILMRLTIKILIPGVYLFLAIAAAETALSNDFLGEIREFICWLIEKSLRVIVYLFTAAISLTGVISGNADALAVKATKTAVSGMIPVVGGILSDASETMLASASVVKNSIGFVGMMAIISVSIIPITRVGVQYLIMKGTAACTGAIGKKEHVKFLKHVSTAMGLLLAMTGTCGLLLLISSVCYIKVMVI